MMEGQAVKVKRELLEACMTCPLCKKLLKDATTISLCLHTFCRKCIHDKLSDEESDTCPVCDIDLGVVPTEKLRPDHNLQDIRSKIFPYKRRKVQAPEAVPSLTLPPARRKERSLSSLVVSTPKMPIQSGRRSRATTRKVYASRSSISPEETGKKEDSAEDKSMSSSSAGSPVGGRYNAKDAKDEAEGDKEVTEGKADLWTPLNCLVEAANRSKSSKLNSQETPLSKSEHVRTPDSDVQVLGSSNGHVSEVNNSKSKKQDMKAEDENNGSNLVNTPVKRRRLASRKRAALSEEISVSAQAQSLVEAPEAKNNRKNSPIWFSLVASEDQNGDASLPQISAGYVRIKDGNMPVSYIQKYIVKKLDLNSEAEVEIMCQGQPVLPTQQLQNLADLWYQTTLASKKLPTAVGSCGKDFVMVLSYCRKV